MSKLKQEKSQWKENMKYSRAHHKERYQMLTQIMKYIGSNRPPRWGGFAISYIIES